MGKKYLDTKKNSLEEAVQKIWNGDTITEAPDDLEMVVLDFDKMSEFKKARNYLDKNGISPPGYGGGGGAQYEFDRDMYGDELTILNIDSIERSRKHPQGLLKMKTKRDVENFLKKGRFKLDIRYIGSSQ